MVGTLRSYPAALSQGRWRSPTDRAGAHAAHSLAVAGQPGEGAVLTAAGVAVFTYRGTGLYLASRDGYLSLAVLMKLAGSFSHLACTSASKLR